MDEVDVMTRAGESVGKAVGTGLRAARQGVVRAGHTAEQKLAEHGVTAQGIRGALVEKAEALVDRAEGVEKSTRRTGKKLAKKSQKARAELLGKAEEVRKEVRRAAKNARKDAKVRAKEVRKAARNASTALGAEAPKHRRWPWVVGLLVASAAAGYVALARRPQETLLREEQTSPDNSPGGHSSSGKVGEAEATEVPDGGQHALNGQLTGPKTTSQ